MAEMIIVSQKLFLFSESDISSVRDFFKRKINRIIEPITIRLDIDINAKGVAR